MYNKIRENLTGEICPGPRTGTHGRGRGHGQMDTDRDTWTWTWTWADPDVFRHFFHSTFFPDFLYRI